MRSRTTRRLLTGVVAVAAVVAATSVATPSEARAAETCFGLTPTIVGTPGTEEVDGTEGDDVIVAEDVSSVYGRGGDDAICVTGPARIAAGDGNDRVRSTADADTHQVVVLGSGSDLFEGSQGRDRVFAERISTEGGPAPGVGDDNTDTVRTFGGPDVVFSGAFGYGDYEEPNQDQVDLGDGDDDVFMETSLGGDAQVDGGPGTDAFRLKTSSGTGSSVLSVDLVAGTVTADGVRLSTVDGFEDVGVGGDGVVEVRGTDGPNVISVTGRASIEAGGGNDSLYLYGDPQSVVGGPGRDAVEIAGYSDFENKPVLYDLRHRVFTRGDVTASFETEKLSVRTTGRTPVHVRVLGTSGRDVVTTEGCGTVVRGAGGNDLLQSWSEQCEGVPTTLRGGRGDDLLQGGHDRDVLLGGPGRDRAFGDGGRDRCRAEVERDCERD